MENVTGGSPPRVREKQINALNEKAGIRITPASAGKTQTETSSQELIQDHPRECGKNLSCALSEGAGLGSPPRVREKLGDFFGGMWDFGITPASAGKT